jgi:hypothetical protein
LGADFFAAGLRMGLRVAGISDLPVENHAIAGGEGEV